MLRSWFLKRGFDVPIPRSAPIVLADRLSDLMSLVLLCALGVYSYHYGHAVVWGVAALIAVIFVVVTVRPLGTAILKRLEGPLGQKRMVHVEQLYDSSAELLNYRRVAVPLCLAVVGWGCEGAGFYLTLTGLGLHLGLLTSEFIYAFSTIVGAVTLLPGGIGTTEGALAGLLKLVGISTATAALAAIIIRAATLWFGVGVGAIFLIVAEKRYGGKKGWGHGS